MISELYSSFIYIYISFFLVSEDEPSANNIDDNKNDSTDESDDGDVFENVKRFFASKGNVSIIRFILPRFNAIQIFFSFVKILLEPVPSTSRESDVTPSDKEKSKKSNKREKIGDDTVEPFEKENEENQEEETGSNFEEIGTY